MATARAQSGVSSYYVPGYNGTPGTINVNRGGQYVRVQLATSQFLVLGEVKVFSATSSLPLPTVLGYKDSTSLLKVYPKLCRVIVKRHAEYRKAQFKAIRHKLAAILHEESPSSLRAAARRLGYDACYLGQQFPDVCQAIAKRHASFRKGHSVERKKEQQARIRGIALHLDSVGTYPSRKRIQEVLNGPMGLNNSEVGAVLREVRTTQLNKERLVRGNRAN